MMDSALRYREMEILSMPPAKRLVLVFTHLLVQLRLARRHAEQKEIEQRAQRLDRAHEIVVELLSTLDREAGGELASRLSGLYGWMITELASLHVRPDLARFDVVIRVVTELHEAWSTIAESAALPAAEATP